MRTLALLAALLLLAFQAQAQTLPETADQVPSQDEPGAKDQDELGAEDLNLLADEIRDVLEAEDIVNSVTEEERLTRGTSGRLKETFCKCQRFYCKFIKFALRIWGTQSKICGG